jgi:hypothetical protein
MPGRRMRVVVEACCWVIMERMWEVFKVERDLRP